MQARKYADRKRQLLIAKIGHNKASNDKKVVVNQTTAFYFTVL